MRRLILGFFGLTLVSGLVFFDGVPSPVEATHSPYHYAIQWTAEGSAVYHHPNCCLYAAYYGWIGVNSQITTPDHFPQMNDANRDHANGKVGLYFNECVGQLCSFIEHGWFAGTFGEIGGGGSCGQNCVRRTTSYGTYVERLDMGSGQYDVHESQTPNLGEAIIYRIERSGIVLNCWNVYIRYNQFVDQYCQLPTGAAPLVGSESYDWPPPGAAVEMPLSNYGWWNPNTNNALRIKGAQGYEPWDAVLFTRDTARYDERCTVPPYQISHSNAWFYFLAKSLGSPISC